MFLCMSVCVRIYRAIWIFCAVVGVEVICIGRRAVVDHPNAALGRVVEDDVDGAVARHLDWDQSVTANQMHDIVRHRLLRGKSHACPNHLYAAHWTTRQTCDGPHQVVERRS